MVARWGGLGGAGGSEGEAAGEEGEGGGVGVVGGGGGAWAGGLGSSEGLFFAFLMCVSTSHGLMKDGNN